MLTGRQRARGLVLSGINPNVPAELEQIVGRMLAGERGASRRRARRRSPPSLRSVAAILDTRTEAAEAAAASEPPRRRGERKRSGSVLALIVALALARRARGVDGGRHDPRNPRGAAISEERLCRRLREHTAGGVDRSRR